MSRASQKDVEGIIDADPSISMAPFIEAATLLTDRVKTCATGKGITLSKSELRVIETWLAAHFYAHRDPLYTAKSTLNASGSFKLESYLETAKLFDPSGCVALLTAAIRAKAGGFWLGKVPSEQTDYVNRD